jgi:hypothetical protein
MTDLRPTVNDYRLDRPQCNSSVRFLKRLDELQSQKLQVNLSDEELEKINEKVFYRFNFNL